MKKGIQIVAMVLSVLGTALYASENLSKGPVLLLKEANQELQILLRETDSSGVESEEDIGRREKIKNLINGIFDFEELGRKALGKKVYSELSAEKQQEFVQSFRNMVEVSSLKNLDVYKSDSILYEEPKYTRQGAKAKVEARSYFKGQETILVYKMLQVDGEWKTWDLVTDDLSTYRNYREQFRSILKKKSVDDLIQILKDKAEESQ
jgi:phospholipid transport system substrate-binding protein